MSYSVIGTGSSGNAVLINEHIMVDCGLSSKALLPYMAEVRLVLLTHCHGDHFKKKTVSKLADERPLIRWACCPWMTPYMADSGVDPFRIDIIAPGQTVDYPGLARVRPEETPHDVPNCCWHIDINGYKIFYATDCGHLDNITAKEYNLYLIEANHTKANLEHRMEMKRMAGQYSYEKRAAKNHLSMEQAMAWLDKNAASWSEVRYLHQHIDK